MGLTERKDAPEFSSGLEVKQMPLKMSPDKIVPVWMKELSERSVKEQLEYLRIGKILFVPLRCEGMALYRKETNDWKIKISSRFQPLFLPLVFGHELGHVLLARDEDFVRLPPKPDSSRPDVWEQAFARKMAWEDICEKFGKAWSEVEGNTRECRQLLHDLSSKRSL